MRRTFAKLALALGLVACGAAPVRGTTSVASAPSDVLRAHKALMVIGEADKDDWRGEAKELASRIAKDLEGQPFFSAVIDGSASDASSRTADVDVVVRVVELAKVSPVERKNLGTSAGEVRMVARIDARDHVTKSALGSATFEARGYEGPHGGTTEDVEAEIEARAVRFLTFAPEPSP